MEIIAQIQSYFDEIDEERLLSVVGTCTDMLARFQIDLSFHGDVQTKLELIQSKQKEVQEKIKEIGMKAHYAVDRYNQHLDIELKKQDNGQPFNIPMNAEDTSIFKIGIIKTPNSEEQYNEVDHVESALIYAQKAGEEFMVWTIFYSQLEEMELRILNRRDIDQKNEPAEMISSVEESGEEMKIKTGLPVNGTIGSSKYLQIFKKEASYELFSYLQTEYTLDDNSPVAKYSYIYHFLVYEQLLTARSQSKYREFIKDNFGIQMSKIFPENDKFNDDIHHLLSRLKSNFERKK